jgi:hypothetical protein
MTSTRDQLHASATAKAEQLREGRSPSNEETTKTRLILPILRCLGWNDESDEVELEAGIGQRDAADIALRLNDRRLVLIEAKSAAERLRTEFEDQVGKYASRDDADLAILTNGHQWWCYLVRASGGWNERRFAELDLLRALDDFVDVLWNVLRREAFGAEDSPAIAAAQSLLTKKRDLHRADEVLPRTWREMLVQPDPELVRLLGQKANVASEEAVLKFLRGVTSATKPTEESKRPDDRKPPTLPLPAETRPVKLMTSPEEAQRQLRTFSHPQYDEKLTTTWHVDREGNVRAYSVCWLFCWGKAKGTAVVPGIFDRILDVDFADFDEAVDHEWARKARGRRDPRLEVELSRIISRLPRKQRPG